MTLPYSTQWSSISLGDAINAGTTPFERTRRITDHQVTGPHSLALSRYTRRELTSELQVIPDNHYNERGSSIIGLESVSIHSSSLTPILDGQTLLSLLRTYSTAANTNIASSAMSIPPYIKIYDVEEEKTYLISPSHADSVHNNRGGTSTRQRSRQSKPYLRHHPHRTENLSKDTKSSSLVQIISSTMGNMSLTCQRRSPIVHVRLTSTERQSLHAVTHPTLSSAHKHRKPKVSAFYVPPVSGLETRIKELDFSGGMDRLTSNLASVDIASSQSLKSD